MSYAVDLRYAILRLSPLLLIIALGAASCNDAGYV